MDGYKLFYHDGQPIKKEKDLQLIFKLASNSKLKKNLQNQVQVYERANTTQQSMKVILYFNETEHQKVNSVLNDLNLQGNPNIILIDACNDKVSASNV